MKNNLLKVGDIINIVNGMEVYVRVPEMFFVDNRKTSKELMTHNVIIGKVYENNIDINENIDTVAKGIVEEFNCEGFNISFEDAKAFVLKKVKQPKKKIFVIKEGIFKVVHTNFEGGGEGMGKHDTYSNGHHVFCKRIGKGNISEIDFYQTGCFTAMIKNIVPIKKLKNKLTKKS